MSNIPHAAWDAAHVSSPLIRTRTPVVTAKGVPYVSNANRLQTLNVYLPKTDGTTSLIGTPIGRLPVSSLTRSPCIHVHIHGGAWRDPNLLASSVEATVALAFQDPSSSPIQAIISINYTLSPFPTHPSLPYDPSLSTTTPDPARDARHPMHIHDVLTALARLHEWGWIVDDGTYVLSGHSCGACLAFQAVLAAPGSWGGASLGRFPRPAALIGLNGLFDLPSLVDDLGASHAQLEKVYANLLEWAFGKDERSVWEIASPTRLKMQWLDEGPGPRIVLIDQSLDDQLVPINQADRMESALRKVRNLKVVRGNRSVGTHAAPWERGDIIWETVKDVLQLL